MRSRIWVLALLVMAGCGPSKSSKAELTMWLVGSEAQAKTINELGREFENNHGIRVRCEAVAWGEAHSKYLTAVAGGVQPDIGTLGLTWGAEFGRLGALVDFRQAFPQDVTAIQQATFPGLWDSIEQDGQVFGIPFDLTVQVLYHRTDLIANAPQTWEELIRLLDAQGQQGRRMIIDWGSMSWIGYAPFLWQAGGDFYNAQKTEAALTSPQAVQALAFFRDLYTRHGVPKTSIPVEQGLRTGDFPLALSGNWKIISLQIGVPEIDGKWSIATLTKGLSGRRTAFLGGRILSVFANSSHKDEAWAFIRYLFEPATQAKLYTGALATQDAYLPPNVGSWEALPMEATMKTVLKQQAQEAKGPPAVAGWNESTHAIEAAIQQVILHDADPKVELEKANAVMNEELRKAKAGAAR